MAKENDDTQPLLFPVPDLPDPPLLTEATAEKPVPLFPQRRKSGRPAPPKLDAQASNVRSFPQAVVTAGRPTQAEEDALLSRIRTARPNVRLERQGLLKAKVWCVTHGVKLGKLIDELLRAFLAGQLPVAGRLDAQTPTDRSDQIEIEDKDVDQSSLSSSISSNPDGRPDAPEPVEACGDPERDRIEEIMAFYSVTTGNPGNQGDIDNLRTVFHFSDDLILAGILRSVVHSTKRVGSMAYCVTTMRQLKKSRIHAPSEFERMYDTFFERVRGGQVKLPLDGQKFLEGKFGKGSE